MKPKGLFVCATPIEGSGLIRTLFLRKSRQEWDHRKVRVFEGSACDLLITGIGRDSANEGLWDFLSRMPTPLWAVGVGVAGGLDEQLGRRAIVVPRVIRSSTEKFLATENLRNEILNHFRGAKSEGDLFTTDHVVFSAKDKVELRKTTGAMAVDMESASWASLFQSKQIPWCIIRSISDSVSDDMPLFFENAWGKFGEPRYSNLISALVKKPARLKDLLRFGTNALSAVATYSAPLVDWVRTNR